MRLVFVAVSFIITISTLTLLQSDNSAKPAAQSAPLIANIATPVQNLPTVIPQPKKKISANLVPTLPTPTTIVPTTIVTQEILAPSPTVIETPQVLQTPIVQTTAPTTPLTTAFETKKPSPTPKPTIIASSTNTSHTYYTSSHWKSKYYYCDTDNDWKTLSATYLKSFSSPEALLQAFPTRILHEPCK